MGISVFPAAGGGGIKSVQRGSAAGSGNVTISSVNISKAFVTCFGTASSGTVAASGGFTSRAFGNNANHWSGSESTYNLSGGTNNLVSAVVQGYLSDSTTLVVSGACRWEVVEFN